MNAISKLAIAIVAIALVIVIGLIVLTADKNDAGSAAATAEPTAQATQEPTPQPTAQPTQAPVEEAQDEAQAEAEMYEGALAGLTQEEIGALAMAEEQGHSGETGEETAQEEGANVEAVAGVAD